MHLHTTSHAHSSESILSLSFSLSLSLMHTHMHTQRNTLQMSRDSQMRAAAGWGGGTGGATGRGGSVGGTDASGGGSGGGRGASGRGGVSPPYPTKSILNLQGLTPSPQSRCSTVEQSGSRTDEASSCCPTTPIPQGIHPHHSTHTHAHAHQHTHTHTHCVRLASQPMRHRCFTLVCPTHVSAIDWYELVLLHERLG